LSVWAGLSPAFIAATERPTGTSRTGSAPGVARRRLIVVDGQTVRNPPGGQGGLPQLGVDHERLTVATLVSVRERAQTQLDGGGSQQELGGRLFAAASHRTCKSWSTRQ
jgi:hypothetical protein